MKSVFDIDDDNSTLNTLNFSNAFLNSVNRNLELQQDFSLLTVALDGFEMLVHTVDQQTSDVIIKEFAKVLFGCICEDDQVFRLSDHEFTIILNNAHKLPSTKVVQNIQKKISKNFFLSALNVFCNIGSADLHDNDNFATLYTRACKALKRNQQDKNSIFASV